MYDSESSSDGGWISWFCDLEGHEFFVEVRISVNWRLSEDWRLLISNRWTLTISKILSTCTDLKSVYHVDTSKWTKCWIAVGQSLNSRLVLSLNLRSSIINFNDEIKTVNMIVKRNTCSKILGFIYIGSNIIIKRGKITA